MVLVCVDVIVMLYAYEVGSGVCGCYSNVVCL